MTRKIMVGSLGLAMLYISGFSLAQEAEYPDAERAEQLLREILVQVVTEHGAEADDLKVLLKAVEVFPRELGPEHPWTLRVMANAGTKQWERGNYTEARRLYEHGPLQRALPLGDVPVDRGLEVKTRRRAVECPETVPLR